PIYNLSGNFVFTMPAFDDNFLNNFAMAMYPGGLPPSANPWLQATKAATRRLTTPPSFTPQPGHPGPGYQGPEPPTIGEPAPGTPAWMRVILALGQAAEDLKYILGDIFVVCEACTKTPFTSHYPDSSI